MAETKRDRTTLLSYIAATGGGHGDVSAQQLRDLLYSVFGSYGVLSVTGGATAQTSIGTTPVKMTLWATEGVSEGITVSAANDEMTMPADGIVAGVCSMTFSGSSNTVFTAEVMKNDTTQGMKGGRTIGTGGDVGNCCFPFGFAVSASDTIETYIVADSGASNSITLVEGVFLAVLIA